MRPRACADRAACACFFRRPPTRGWRRRFLPILRCGPRDRPLEPLLPNQCGCVASRRGALRGVSLVLCLPWWRQLRRGRDSIVGSPPLPPLLLPLSTVTLRSPQHWLLWDNSLRHLLWRPVALLADLASARSRSLASHVAPCLLVCDPAIAFCINTLRGTAVSPLLWGVTRNLALHGSLCFNCRRNILRCLREAAIVSAASCPWRTCVGCGASIVLGGRRRVCCGPVRVCEHTPTTPARLLFVPTPIR